MREGKRQRYTEREKETETQTERDCYGVIMP